MGRRLDAVGSRAGAAEWRWDERGEGIEEMIPIPNHISGFTPASTTPQRESHHAEHVQSAFAAVMAEMTSGNRQ